MLPSQTHIVLVSDQAAPNVLPTLDPEMKPKNVIMLVSEKMRGSADTLEHLLKHNGIETKRVNLINEHDFNGLQETMMNLAVDAGDRIAVNITGGTKLMALAIYQVAKVAEWKTFYVDIDTDEVIWIDPNKQNKHKLTQQLRLRHYLLGYGFQMEGQIQKPQIEYRYKSVIDTLLRQIASLEVPLSQLNWLSQIAEDKKSLSVSMDERQLNNIGLSVLLRNFEEVGSLKTEGSTIRFADECERNFVKGGWLEQYVYQTVDSLREELGIRDSAANLKIVKDGNTKELDVVFLAKNRLFVIECKTARMDKPEAPKANDALFKLADVSRVGGKGAKKMLVSYRSMRDSEKNLAKALGIQLVTGEQINRLKEKIKRWVQN